MDLTRLENLRGDMEKCFRCSLCKMVPLPVANNPEFTDACPAARHYAFHGYSGSGKQIMAMSLLDGRIKADDALARTTFACTTCGYCDVACKFIMDAERHQVNMALREHLVEQGLSPKPHQAAIENLQTYGNAKGEPKSKAGDWAEGLGLKILPEQKAQVLLLAGCTVRNDERSAGVARKLAQLLLHAGVDVGILGDAESCCGLPAYWMGYRDVYTETAQKNAALIDSLGVSTVVITSGSCLGSLRSKYPEYGAQMNTEVLHATELLARLISSAALKLPKTVKAKVTYHDPCYLGRQSEPYQKYEGQEKITLGVMNYKDPPKKVNLGVEGVYEPPREILKAIPGIEFTEMHRIREYSYCCGAGGGAALAFPEMAASAATHRLDEAGSVGAEKLVTACGHCETHFRNVQESSAAGGPEVVDIIDLVYRAAGLEG